MAMPQQKTQGLQAVLDMLRVMDISSRENLLANIAKENASFAALLRQQLYWFEDLINLSPRELQTLLRGIDEDKLALALRGQKSEVVEAMLKNLAPRIADGVRDLIESSSPRRKSEVEEAQTEIMEFAKALDREGKINLRKEANEEWVD